MAKNVVLVVSDTLRLDYIGCYGNDSVSTPHMDSLAGKSTRFDNAFPESLPTIPVRRALHTGRRAYPFANYSPVEWDIVSLPGWEPMRNEEDTLAENLAKAGYHTGLVTDTLPYFAPGLNFARGFHQWDFVRGQQNDRWRSPYSVSRESLARQGNPEELMENPYGVIPQTLANISRMEREEETSTARTFLSAIDFIEENGGEAPFYLMIDCFDPHEPWIAPEKYSAMYVDPNYDGRPLMFANYGVATEYTDEEVEYIKAQYSGLVSLVDAWLGEFLKRLSELGLEGDTAVVLTSDHGTNFCENPRRVIGKPAYSMYPAVMRLPLLMSIPGMGNGACDDFVYDVDITATIYALCGVEPEQEIDGRSLMPLISGTGEWKQRDYVTCRYGHALCYLDRERWMITDVDGEAWEAFDLVGDPKCRSGDWEAGRDDVRLAWERLLVDAGGELPDYRERPKTDAIGR
jgi:arylsulfatase A-like enzyme